MCALTQGRPKAEYNCAQKDFYTIVKSGWMSYSEHLPDFMNFKTSYTAATATAQLAALTAARAMPDEGSRTGMHKALRIELVPLAETCIAAWSDMSSYIRDGFAADLYDTKREAAGYAYYRGALEQDWDSVSELIVQGVDFANANTAALTAGGMPPSFIASMTVARDAFELKYGDFVAAEELTKQMTDAKTEANNALHVSLTAMFEDGKKVFRNNAAVREEFTFERILNMINGGGNSTPTTTKLAGVITDAFTLLPIEGALIVAGDANGSEQTTSGVGGFYSFSFAGLTEPMSGTLTVSHPMYVTAARSITLEPGVNRNEDFGLSPTPPPPPMP